MLMCCLSNSTAVSPTSINGNQSTALGAGAEAEGPARARQTCIHRFSSALGEFVTALARTQPYARLPHQRHEGPSNRHTHRARMISYGLELVYVPPPSNRPCPK
jgi:hypothetical protein